MLFILPTRGEFSHKMAQKWFFTIWDVILYLFLEIYFKNKFNFSVNCREFISPNNFRVIKLSSARSIEKIILKVVCNEKGGGSARWQSLSIVVWDRDNRGLFEI